MNSSAPPRFSLEPLDAFCASLRLWLFEMAALVLTLVGGKGAATRALKRFIAAEVRATTIDARRVFFLLMCAQLRARPQPRRRARRPGAAGPGFRRARRRPGAYRCLTRVLCRGGGTLLQRLARLRDLIDRRGHWVARLVARFERGHAGLRLIAVAPAAWMAFSQSPATTACADTS